MKTGWLITTAACIAILGLLTWIALPKGVALRAPGAGHLPPDLASLLEYTAYYRGLGIPDAPGALGRVWIGVELELDDFLWRVDFAGEGYNNFRAYYPDGTLREEGECYVPTRSGGKPGRPETTDIRWVRCYRPDGTLGSEVIGGEGKHIVWRPDGTRQSETTYENGQRTRSVSYWDNGQVLSETLYRDGKRHGPFRRFYPSGAVMAEGSYEDGERSGPWTYYEEDGTIAEGREYPEDAGP